MMPTSLIEKTILNSWLSIVYINSFLDLVKDIWVHLPMFDFLNEYVHTNLRIEQNLFAT